MLPALLLSALVAAAPAPAPTASGGVYEGKPRVRATLVSDGAGSYLPASRVLRGNDNLNFLDATASTFPGAHFPTIANVSATLKSATDFGLAHASAIGDLDGDGNQNLVLCVNGYFQPAVTWTCLSAGVPVKSPNLSTTYYTIKYPGTRIWRNAGGSAF